MKNAREKSNELNVAGAVATAAVLGVLCGSWTVFAVVGVLLIAAGISSGDIRPDRKSEQR